MPRHADPAWEALWRRRMRQQPLSRLTIQQFWKREGVSTAAFHAWKRRLALRAAFPTTPAAPPAFVPVVVPAVHESQPRGATELLTIRLANGGQILLPITADVALVREVVATVARCSAAREGSAC